MRQALACLLIFWLLDEEGKVRAIKRRVVFSEIRRPEFTNKTLWGTNNSKKSSLKPKSWGYL